MLEKLTIIHRVDIRMVTQVVEEGKPHFLGEQRDFRRHPVIAEFLAETENARLGIAWVRLAPGQILAPHQHPVRSLILLVRGQGVVLDNGEIPLLEGDAVLVPSMYLHGFRGEGPDGAYGLSIQFEERGLYEDEHNPLVNFDPAR
jgi:quercetin dioxygenase-like cupin family protein